MSELRFDNKTVVVTGAGGGLGKAYALFFGSKGANVVVNDVGGSLKGLGQDGKPAELVAQQIRNSGGIAVSNYDSVLNGEKIIAQAVAQFGAVHILINNAGVLRDAAFKNLKQEDWDVVIAVHLKGAYKCTNAAWPHFRTQKYGRIINTTSAAGLYGNFGQTNYSAAKLGLVGFTETLAREGAKYNILVNAIAPAAASRMTETILPPDVLAKLSPEWVVPVVSVLAHHSNTTESSGIFEVGAGHVSKLRWERSRGLLLRADSSLTPGAVVSQWNKVGNFENAEYPNAPVDYMQFLKASEGLPPVTNAPIINFEGKVVLITGAGAGLGRAYALSFARYGASVVANDLQGVDSVVSEIRAAGGKAIGVKAPAQDGVKNVEAAISAFGRIDIVLNNAGILRDKSFQNMNEKLWDDVLDVHLNGTYQTCKAAWPYFVAQKYGRILNTTSVSGIYGSFGQANYATAKAAIIGFSRALAREGKKYNIYVNCIAPNAGTTMTRSILPEEVILALKPDFVAPMALALCSDHVPVDPSGGLYEVGSGWIGKTRWQRSQGYNFPTQTPLTPEAVFSKWKSIADFVGSDDHPESPDDGMREIMKNATVNKEPSQDTVQTKDFLKNIELAKSMTSSGTSYVFTDKEVILYALSIGVKEDNLKLVFEQDSQFHALPTFGVVPFFAANMNTPYNLDDIVPNFSPTRLLHAEQYLEIRGAIPTCGTLTTYPQLLEVLDKGKAAIVKQGFTTRDENGKDLFYNETTVFIRGSGGFGGTTKPADRGAATSLNQAPSRSPDRTVLEKTTADQAALYRLNGDRNPLHIDPKFSKAGGFEVPILHGLCSMGIAGKHIYEAYGPYKNIKVKLSGIVLPGQTLKTEMWKEKNRILFQVFVVETGKLAISSGGADLI